VSIVHPHSHPRLDVEAVPTPRVAPDGDPGGVGVVLLGQRALVRCLAGALPSGWTVRAAADLDALRGDDEFLVLTNPTGDEVRAARRRWPRTEVVALIDRRAPTSMVVEAMDAGTAACIREPIAALVAGYLVRLHATRRVGCDE
jgi:hypothetical protein